MSRSLEKTVLRSVSLPLALWRLSNIVSGLVLTILSSRSLGASGRGFLVGALQAVYVAGVVVAGGADRAALVWAGKRGAEQTAAAVLRYLRGAVLTISIAGGLIGLVLWPVPGQLVAVVTILLLGEVTATAIVTLSMINGSSRRIATSLSAANALSATIGVSLYLGGEDRWAIWSLAYAVPTATACVWAILPHLRVPLQRRDGFARAAFQASGSPLASIALLRADRLILAVLGFSTQLGVYATVGVLTELFIAAVRLLIDPQVPSWSSQADSGRAAKRSMMTILIFALPYAICFAVLGPHLLVPIFGPSFEDGKALCLPLAAATVAYCVYYVSSAAAAASGQVQASSRRAIVGACVAVPLYFASAAQWQALGVAWASVPAYLIAAYLQMSLVYGRRHRWAS